MTAIAPTIEKVIEKHLEELGFLWRQRSAAFRSPDWRPIEFKRMAGRIEAHLDGLRIAARANSAAVSAHLKGEDPWAAVSACVALLQLQLPEAANAIVDALLAADPKQADAIRRALLLGPIDLIEEPLRAAADSAPPHIAAVAIEALLYHGRMSVKIERLLELVRHEDPAIRAAAWRIVALESRL